MAAYYNENDVRAAAWLRELIKGKHIADGEVDSRSIVDVTADDLRGFRQCHFFAGIGGWSLALRLAGWDDDRPVWTGSCPCQPFSAAGKGAGFTDERHLWPAWHWLIERCRPTTIFGEQVASTDGLYWLDLVKADLEGTHYAFGVCDLSAASVGAFHIRQRLYFVANADRKGRDWVTTSRLHERRKATSCNEPETHDPDGSCWNDVARRGESGHMADANRQGRGTWRRGQPCDGRDTEGSQQPARLRDHRGLADADSPVASDTGLQRGGRQLQSAENTTPSLVGDALSPRLEGHAGDGDGRNQPGWFDTDQDRSTTTTSGTDEVGNGHIGRGEGASTPDSFWRDPDWLRCRDGKWRPVRSGSFPLAHGVPNRMVKLRGFGNGIVPPLAATFIKAYEDTLA